jgi:hypothetical protein
LKQQHEAEVAAVQNDLGKLKQQVMTYMNDLRQSMAVDELPSAFGAIL